MPSARYDLRYLESALEVCEEYLKSPELYWAMSVAPPDGEPPYPRLTIGNVLLALQRLQRPLTPEEAAELDALARQVAECQQKYRALVESKAEKEAQMRARLWAQYIDELAREEAAKAYYRTEVRNRVILELLQQAAPLSEAVHTLRTHADRRLQARFEPGPFVWEEELEPAFPPQPFWYLYGRPK